MESPCSQLSHKYMVCIQMSCLNASFPYKITLNTEKKKTLKIRKEKIIWIFINLSRKWHHSFCSISYQKTLCVIESLSCQGGQFIMYKGKSNARGSYNRFKHSVQTLICRVWKGVQSHVLPACPSGYVLLISCWNHWIRTGAGKNKEGSSAPDVSCVLVSPSS